MKSRKLASRNELLLEKSEENGSDDRLPLASIERSSHQTLVPS